MTGATTASSRSPRAAGRGRGRRLHAASSRRLPARDRATLAAAKAVAEAARKGEGNLRYDVVRSVNRRKPHDVFAAWQNRKAFDAYENSA